MILMSQIFYLNWPKVSCLFYLRHKQSTLVEICKYNQPVRNIGSPVSRVQNPQFSAKCATMMAQTAFEVNIDFQGIRAILSRVVTPMVVRRYSSSFKTMLLICEHNEIQWGSEYQPFEYCKHLNLELFEARISNGRFMCYCYKLIQGVFFVSVIV